jgi:hypothetical protein
MTVPYANQVPPRFSSLGWWKTVVCRWTGGIYKLVGVELAAFILMWYIVWGASSNFNFVAKSTDFDEYVKSFRLYQGSIRVMLGFMLVYYYQEIYSRARRIFFAIPFPDSTFIAINSVVGSSGKDRARGHLLKQTIFRYILATTFQCYHASSKMFQRRYPKPWESMVKLGLLTSEETQRMRDRISEYPYPGEVSFVPIAWATMTLRRAFLENQVMPNKSAGEAYPTIVELAMKALHDYRSQYGSLLFEVYFPFPLLLSQLVTLVVYSYFVVALVAQQNQSNEPTFLFPLFTVMEFVVYIGALRVGQTFTNPLGEDENCFEMVAFFNRNLRLAHLYGAYGPSTKYDMIANELPLVDLTDKQSGCLPSVPLHFYRWKDARQPVYPAPLTRSPDSEGNRREESMSIPLIERDETTFATVFTS